MQTNSYLPRAYADPAQRPPAQPFFHDWTAELRRWEFMLTQGGVFFAPYLAFRHPSFYITISDIFFAGAFALRLSTRRLEAPFANLTWLWLLGLLMLNVGLFLGSMFKGDMMRALILIAQYCFAYLLVPLVVLRRPEEEVVRLIKCGIWGMVVMCAVGAVLFLSGFEGFGKGQMEIITGNKRLSGFVDNPNGMAVLTGLALPMVWLLLLTRNMRPWVGLLCCCLLVYGTILTSSNTGLYSMIAATLIFFGGLRKVKTLIAIGALGWAVLMFGTDYLPTTFQNRVLSAVETGDMSTAGTFEDRQELNREALEMADNNLIIGIGADQYRYVSRYGHVVHNLYLLLLNEGGGLSLLGYLVILAVPLIIALNIRNTPNGRLIMLTIVTTILVSANAFMASPHVYGRAWFMFAFLAVSPALISKKAGGREPIPRGRRRSR